MCNELAYVNPPNTSSVYLKHYKPYSYTWSKSCWDRSKTISLTASSLCYKCDCFCLQTRRQAGERWEAKACTDRWWPKSNVCIRLCRRIAQRVPELCHRSVLSHVANAESSRESSNWQSWSNDEFDYVNVFCATLLETDNGSWLEICLHLL